MVGVIDFITTQSFNINSANVSIVCTCCVLDQGFAAAGLSDGSIRVWKPTRGDNRKSKPLCISGHDGPVQSMVFLPEYDGVIISAGADGTIRSNSPLLGKQNESWKVHTGTVLALARADDALLSSSTDRTIRVFRIRPGKNGPRLRQIQLIRVQAWAPTIAFIKPKQGFIGFMNGHMCEILPKTGEADDITSSMISYSEESSGTYYSPVSSFDLGEYEGDWDTDVPCSTFHYRLDVSYRTHRLGITCLRIFHKPSIMVTLGNDEKFKVYDIVTKRCIFTEMNPVRAVYTSVLWNEMEKELIFSDKKGNIQFWSLKTEKLTFQDSLLNTSILDIRWTRSGNVAVTTEKEVNIYKIEKSKTVDKVDGHHGSVVGMLVLPPASESQDHPSFNFWQRMEEKLVGSDASEEDESIDENSDAKVNRLSKELSEINWKLYSAGQDNMVHGWVIPDVKFCHSMTSNPDSEVCALAYIPDTRMLVLGYQNGQLCLGNTDSHSLVPFSDSPTSTISTIHSIWSRDLLLVGCLDSKLYVYSIHGRLVNPMPIFYRELQLASIPRVIADDDNSVYVACGNMIEKREANRNCRSLKVFHGHHHDILSLALDGIFLFSGDAQGRVFMWETTLGILVRKIKTPELSCCVQLNITRLTGYLLCTSKEGIKFVDYVKNEHKHFIATSEEVTTVLLIGNILLVGTKVGHIERHTIPNEIIYNTLEPPHSEPEGVGEKYSKENNEADEEENKSELSEESSLGPQYRFKMTLSPLKE